MFTLGNFGRSTLTEDGVLPALWGKEGRKGDIPLPVQQGDILGGLVTRGRIGGREISRLGRVMQGCPLLPYSALF